MPDPWTHALPEMTARRHDAARLLELSTAYAGKAGGPVRPPFACMSPADQAEALELWERIRPSWDAAGLPPYGG